MFLQNANKIECTGCGACVDVCPHKCIKMALDDEDFLYPQIDASKCAKCGACEKVCPVVFDKLPSEKPLAFAGVHNAEGVVDKSASGGAFTAIYKEMLEVGTNIWGVKFDENFQAIHDSTKDEHECELFRKSKYILSNTNSCYSKIEKQLKNDERVLFTGTPCQCAALHNYLDFKKIKKERLLVVDLICHGAPNQQLFDDYKEELENKEGKKIVSFSFRNKEPHNGKINSRTAKIVFDSGESKIVGIEDDPFLKGYYSRLFYRPSCAHCQFARIERVSDLTIGDAWQIEDIYPNWDSLNGVSLTLVNTEKGRVFFEKLKHQMTLERVEVEWAKKTNSQLVRPTEMHKKRKKFFGLRRKYGFEKAVRIATKRSFVRRVLSRCKRIVKRVVGKA